MNYDYRRYPYPFRVDPPMYNIDCRSKKCPRDYGPYPFTFNISEATKANDNFRTTVWTGKHLQLTLMSIPAGGEIGLEVHYYLDQFLRIEKGCGMVLMGNDENKLDFREKVTDGYAIFVPAGIWHNLINTSNKPIKLYSIYSPPAHAPGTIHRTKEDSDYADQH